MTIYDHLAQLAGILNRALAELPAAQRNILADLAQTHVAALDQALREPAAKSDEQVEHG